MFPRPRPPGAKAILLVYLDAAGMAPPVLPRKAGRRSFRRKKRLFLENRLASGAGVEAALADRRLYGLFCSLLGFANNILKRRATKQRRMNPAFGAGWL